MKSVKYDWSKVFIGKRLTIYGFILPILTDPEVLALKSYSNAHSPCCLWTDEWRLYLHLKLAVTFSHDFKLTRKSKSAPRHFYELTLFSGFC